MPFYFSAATLSRFFICNNADSSYSGFFYKCGKRFSSAASAPTNAIATATIAGDGSVPDFAKGKRRQRPRQAPLPVRADVPDEQETPACRVGGPRLRLVEALSRGGGISVDPQAGGISFVLRRRWLRPHSINTIVVIIKSILVVVVAVVIRRRGRMNHVQLRRGTESALPGRAGSAAAAKKGRGATASVSSASAALPHDRLQL